MTDAMLACEDDEHVQGEFVECKDGESIYTCLECGESYVEPEDSGCGG